MGGSASTAIAVPTETGYNGARSRVEQGNKDNSGENGHGSTWFLAMHCTGEGTVPLLVNRQSGEQLHPGEVQKRIQSCVGKKGRLTSQIETMVYLPSEQIPKFAKVIIEDWARNPTKLCFDLRDPTSLALVPELSYWNCTHGRTVMHIHGMLRRMHIQATLSRVHACVQSQGEKATTRVRSEDEIIQMCKLDPKGHSSEEMSSEDSMPYLSKVLNGLLLTTEGTLSQEMCNAMAQKDESLFLYQLWTKTRCASDSMIQRGFIDGNLSLLLRLNGSLYHGTMCFAPLFLAARLYLEARLYTVHQRQQYLLLHSLELTQRLRWENEKDFRDSLVSEMDLFCFETNVIDTDSMIELFQFGITAVSILSHLVEKGEDSSFLESIFIPFSRVLVRAVDKHQLHRQEEKEAAQELWNHLHELYLTAGRNGRNDLCEQINVLKASFFVFILEMQGSAYSFIRDTAELELLNDKRIDSAGTESVFCVLMQHLSKTQNIHKLASVAFGEKQHLNGYHVIQKHLQRSDNPLYFRRVVRILCDAQQFGDTRYYSDDMNLGPLFSALTQDLVNASQPYRFSSILDAMFGHLKCSTCSNATFCDLMYFAQDIVSKALFEKRSYTSTLDTIHPILDFAISLLKYMNRILIEQPISFPELCRITLIAIPFFAALPHCLPVWSSVDASVFWIYEELEQIHTALPCLAVPTTEAETIRPLHTCNRDVELVLDGGSIFEDIFVSDRNVEMLHDQSFLKNNLREQLQDKIFLPKAQKDEVITYFDVHADKIVHHMVLFLTSWKVDANTAIESLSCSCAFTHLLCMVFSCSLLDLSTTIFNTESIFCFVRQRYFTSMHVYADYIHSDTSNHSAVSILEEVVGETLSHLECIALRETTTAIHEDLFFSRGMLVKTEEAELCYDNPVQGFSQSVFSFHVPLQTLMQRMSLDVDGASLANLKDALTHSSLFQKRIPLSMRSTDIGSCLWYGFICHVHLLDKLQELKQLIRDNDAKAMVHVMQKGEYTWIRELWAHVLRAVPKFVMLHQQSTEFYCDVFHCTARCTQTSVNFECTNGHQVNSPIERNTFSYDFIYKSFLARCCILLRLHSPLSTASDTIPGLMKSEVSLLNDPQQSNNAGLSFFEPMFQKRGKQNSSVKPRASFQCTPISIGGKEFSAVIQSHILTFLLDFDTDPDQVFHSISSRQKLHLWKAVLLQRFLKRFSKSEERTSRHTYQYHVYNALIATLLGNVDTSFDDTGHMARLFRHLVERYISSLFDSADASSNDDLHLATLPCIAKAWLRSGIAVSFEKYDLSSFFKRMSSLDQLHSFASNEMETAFIIASIVGDSLERSVPVSIEKQVSTMKFQQKRFSISQETSYASTLQFVAPLRFLVESIRHNIESKNDESLHCQLASLCVVTCHAKQESLQQGQSALYELLLSSELLNTQIYSALFNTIESDCAVERSLSTSYGAYAICTELVSILSPSALEPLLGKSLKRFFVSQLRNLGLLSTYQFTDACFNLEWLTKRKSSIILKRRLLHSICTNGYAQQTLAQIVCTYASYIRETKDAFLDMESQQEACLSGKKRTKILSTVGLLVCISPMASLHTIGERVEIVGDLARKGTRLSFSETSIAVLFDDKIHFEPESVPHEYARSEAFDELFRETKFLFDDLSIPLLDVCTHSLASSADRRKSSLTNGAQKRSKEATPLLAFFFETACGALHFLLAKDPFNALHKKHDDPVLRQRLCQLIQVCKTPIPLHELVDLSQINENKALQAALLLEETVSGQLCPSEVDQFAQQLQKKGQFHHQYCRRAALKFHSIAHQDTAVAWLKEITAQKRGRSPRKNLADSNADTELDFVALEKAKRLRSLGFPIDVCKKALTLTNGNEFDAANWLIENGTDMVRLRRMRSRSSSNRRANPDDACIDVHAEEQIWGQIGADGFHETGDFDPCRDIHHGFSRATLDPHSAFVRFHAKSTRQRAVFSSRIKRNMDSTSLKFNDMYCGQVVRISTIWASAMEQRVSAKLQPHTWYLGTIQNTWEPFVDSLSDQLEQRWLMGDTSCHAILDEELFTFRLDRMAMYHSESGYMVRLKRKPSLLKIVDFASRNGATSNEHEAITSKWTDQQKQLLERLKLIFPKSSVFLHTKALSLSNFNLQQAVEWLLLHRSSSVTSSAPEKEEIKSTTEKHSHQRTCREDAFLLLLQRVGEPGIIRFIDRENQEVEVEVFNPTKNKMQLLRVPADALEWIDQNMMEACPELRMRNQSGISGLYIDTCISHALIKSRLAVFSILNSSLSPCSKVQFNTLRLQVNDVISLLKLIQPHLNGRGVDTAAYQVSDVLQAMLQHYMYVDETATVIIDDICEHLLRTSHRVVEFESAHPYAHGEKVKEKLAVPNSAELVVEFDARSSLKEGHSSISFFRDEECIEEIVSFSGSSYCYGLSRLDNGFCPFVVTGSKVWMLFQSNQSKAPSPKQFGCSVRVRSNSLSYADERDLLNAPIGWDVIPLLLCSRTLWSDHNSESLNQFPATPIDTILNDRQSAQLIKSLSRYMMCASSPCKAFVGRTLCSLLQHLVTHFDWTQSNWTKEEFFGCIGGTGLMHELQKTRKMARDNSLHSSTGIKYSPFAKSLVDCIRIFGSLFPHSKYVSAGVPLIVYENPFDVPIPFGANAAVDMERVERCMVCILNGDPFPSLHLIEMAYEHVGPMQLFKLSLKELETSIRVDMQSDQWKQDRIAWISSVNAAETVSSLSKTMFQLKQSLAHTAFQETWLVREQHWDLAIQRCSSIEEVAQCLLSLEQNLITTDSKREGALVTSWRHSRRSWDVLLFKAQTGELRRTIQSLPTPSAANAFSWCIEADQDIVALVDHYTTTTGARLRALSCNDIASVIELYHKMPPSLREVPLSHVQSRFAVLKLMNQLMAGLVVLPCDLYYREPWSLSALVLSLKKTFFLEAKLALLNQQVARLFSNESEPQNVILNRYEAQKLGSGIQQSLLYQLFVQLRFVDPSLLRRKNQSWKVKFVGEGGHDVGGLFNVCLSDVCSELMSDKVDLFLPTPNQVHDIGISREKWILNTRLTEVSKQMLEFVGKIIGIACLTLGRTLSLDLSALLWKRLVCDPVASADVAEFDHTTARMLHILRFPEQHSITMENFEDTFPDMFFVVQPLHAIAKQTEDFIELKDGGAGTRVTFDNRLEFLTLLEKYRLHEYDEAIGYLTRGIGTIIPLEILPLFTWKQLEELVCGTPDINIHMLRDKTVYEATTTPNEDHIAMFWDILNSFGAHQRTQLLQFVWGRSRLPSGKAGFGKDVFRITDHVPSMLDEDQRDCYFPVAHTCFFSLELPRYSTRAVMHDRLLFAIENCKTIDADTTQESMMNLNMGWTQETEI